MLVTFVLGHELQDHAKEGKACAHHGVEFFPGEEIRQQLLGAEVEAEAVEGVDETKEVAQSREEINQPVFSQSVQGAIPFGYPGRAYRPPGGGDPSLQA